MRQDEIVIRAAEVRDLGRIAELWAEVAECHARIDRRFSPAAPDGKEKVRKWMGEAIGKEGRLLLVGVLEGNVVGALHGQISTGPPPLVRQVVGLITDLFVDKALRRRGIGQKLVEASMRRFQEQGAVGVKMSVWVRNEGGVRFWEALGFEVMTEGRWKSVEH